MEEYNRKCNNNFLTSINDKYIISFYDNNDNEKIIILKLNNKVIWATYKIICSYNINKNIIKLASDMIIIEQKIIDHKLIDDKRNLKKYKSIDDLENYIMENILAHYIGYVIKQDSHIIYFIGIEKIIRF